MPRRRKQKPKPKKPNEPLRTRATREIEHSLQPLLSEIGRQESGLGPMYAGLQEQLAPLAGQYQADLGGIQSRYSEGIASLQNLLGGSAGATLGGAAAAEAPAATGAFGAIGAGGLGMLAQTGARNVGYQTSALRQSALQQLAERQDLARRRQDLYSDVPERVLERLDQLREQRLQQQQLRQGLTSEKAFNQFLQNQLGVYLGQHGKKKNRRK